MDKIYNRIKEAKRIVVKIGTSSLTYSTGKLNIRQIEKLIRVLSDIRNQGREVILVSSGAISVGAGKLGLKERPRETRFKQAAASVGQCELMYLYDKLFSEYNNTAAQILLTKSDIDEDKRVINTKNTINTLLEMGIIPVVNENDTVSTDEIEFGDNDTLSAIVAKLVEADLLVIFSDIDGLYTADPHKDENAKLIEIITEIDDSVKALAGDTVTNRGTGGMITKLTAAEIATGSGIDMIVANGNNVEALYTMLDGKPHGTIFTAK